MDELTTTADVAEIPTTAPIAPPRNSTPPAKNDVFFLADSIADLFRNFCSTGRSSIPAATRPIARTTAPAKIIDAEVASVLPTLMPRNINTIPRIHIPMP